VTSTLLHVARRILGLVFVVVIGALIVAAVFGRVVPMTGRTTFVVNGLSMEPAIPVGAAVVAEPVDPATLQVGDVVSIRVGPARAIFTHRITRIVQRDGSPWIETKGDANPSEDPALIPAADVIGRVGLVVPDLGYLLALLSTLSGVALALGLLGGTLAARALIGTFRAA